LVAIAALTTFIHCAEKKKDAAADPACTGTGTQALQALGLRGSSMPPKALALTFDDGPGPRTKALSAYLKKEGIQAAFFVNGKSMQFGGAEILAQLVADGHLVANHTETHRSLTGRSTPGVAGLTPGEIVQELTDTDVKIETFVKGQRFLFRPPFGDYDESSFAALSGSPMNKYVGPILWDVGDKMDEGAGKVADWDCWIEGSDNKRTPMTQCGDMYLTEIRRASRGIVLLHDPYYNDQDPEQLGTVDMVQYMVPKLKEEGFIFMRVDLVPDIAALLPPLAPEDMPGADAGAATPEGQAPAGGAAPCP
jgi:peptidoglycan/xylan/chitin deacetylase (PgdA/CDA1 family)